MSCKGLCLIKWHEKWLTTSHVMWWSPPCYELARPLLTWETTFKLKGNCNTDSYWTDVPHSSLALWNSLSFFPSDCDPCGGTLGKCKTSTCTSIYKLCTGNFETPPCDQAREPVTLRNANECSISATSPGVLRSVSLSTTQDGVYSHCYAMTVLYSSHIHRKNTAISILL
jgi:hypothetical protein